MLGSLQYAALERFCKREKTVEGQPDTSTPYSKLDFHFGSEWRDAVRGRAVADFGCGSAREVIEIAHAGARVVYGIEISETYLRQARQRIASSDVSDRCRLLTTGDCEPADVVFSFDAFEHFEKPREILQQMYSLLKPGGKLYVSFGPTWYHPMGGHAFSPFPWAHIFCSESALVRWRNLYFPGTSVSINTSGLNRMTVRRFLSLCRESGFAVEKEQIVPIRRLRFLHNRLTREFTTAVVRVILRK